MNKFWATFGLTYKSKVKSKSFIIFMAIVIILMIWSLFKSLGEEKPRPSNKILVKDRDSDVLEYKSSKDKKSF